MTDLQNLLSLPLEQQIGQLLYIGLPGTELDREARSLVEEIHPGGVIIIIAHTATGGSIGTSRSPFMAPAPPECRWVLR